MADQSTLQQLLQQGVGLQSNAQSNTMLTPNNGNPNTIYNLARPNVTQFNPLTGRLPAMGDANGNWAVPAQGLGTNLGPALPPGVQQNVVRPTIPAGEFVIPPVIIPGLTPPPAPVNPPMDGTPVPKPGMGGGTQPPAVTQEDGGTFRPTPGGGYTWDSFSVPGGPGGFGGVGGTGTASDPLANWGNGLNMAGFLQGAKGDTGGTILEILDKLSEPFLPGDMVQGGNFNWRQMLESVAKQYGIPIEQAANLLGQGDKYRAWVSQGYGNLPGDTRFGSLQDGNTEGYGMGQINPITGQLSAGLLNNISIPQSNVPTSFGDNAANMAAVFGPNWNAPAQTAPTRGQIAGAGGIGGSYIDANGNKQFDTSGQDMLAAMKLSSLARGTRQTGGDLYGHAYER